MTPPPITQGELYANTHAGSVHRKPVLWITMGLPQGFSVTISWIAGRLRYVEWRKLSS
jgi:hypothetical protein